jgi:hypothetical protein
MVDIIWAMANHHSDVDEFWMSGPEVDVRGRMLRVIPAEAMVFDKLFIMQRDRCDWPDVLNLVYWAGADMDWKAVLRKIGNDRALLAGLLSVYRWLSPGRAMALPDWLWETVGLPRAGGQWEPDVDARNVSLLDRRPWFGPDRANLQPA